MGKGYSRRSMAIELLNGKYEKMVLRIEELEKENKLLKKNQIIWKVYLMLLSSSSTGYLLP